MANPDNPGQTPAPEDEPSAATAAGEPDPSGTAATDATGEGGQETEDQGTQEDTKFQG